MFFLNLSLGQFLVLSGGTSALVVALYLLDRSRRRQTVATLRFWIASQRPAETRRRRRIQQPLSLILQLLSIVLLLLALAQLRLGWRGPASRDHVLILDTGAWMAARSGKTALIDEAHALARAYVQALPARDRVMVVRADALATPATAFESSRKVVEEAIDRSQPGATALRLEQALEFASQAQKLRAGSPGEIVFVGAGRVLEDEAESVIKTPPNLRLLPVSGAVENCGLRKIGLRRSAGDPAVWEIFVSVRNYGTAARAVHLSLQFGGAPVGSKELALAAGAEQNARFQLRTRAAGWLEARMTLDDAFPGDDHAVLELPALRPVKVLVYSEEPAALRPILVANPWISAEFRRPALYDEAAPADLVILDRFRPRSFPRCHAIWIEPPPEGSPAVVRTVLRNVVLTRWRSDHPLASGIRTQDLRLEQTEVYAAAPGDITVAETDGGAVILAREGKPKFVVLGFHPGRSAMRYELAAPLLFANILRWMEPGVFRRWELNAGSAGTLSVDLEPEAAAQDLRVLSGDGNPVPYTIQDRSLRFFAANPGTVRILTGDSELVYSLTLPQVAESRWQAPAEVRRGLPAAASMEPSYAELWPWLALAGALGLLIEWLLFGRDRTARQIRWRAPALLRITAWGSWFGKLVRSGGRAGRHPPQQAEGARR